MSNAVFRQLFEQYRELQAMGLSDTENAHRLFAEMMNYAPPEYMEAAQRIAKEMGILPARPDAYDDNGEPLYSLEGIAARLGIDPEQAMAEMPDFIREGVYIGTAHRVQ